ncbi:MAG TPA: hypothetical protein DDZ04_03370, partial [Parabacteroides sp.]|nr:hypothetical protein [Parabacteroides sp.]
IRQVSHQYGKEHRRDDVGTRIYHSCKHRPEREALAATENLIHHLGNGMSQAEMMNEIDRYRQDKTCQYKHYHAVAMVKVRGTSDTKVLLHEQQAMRAMPFCTVPIDGVMLLMAVALNTGMVKSWLTTCERVQHVPQLQGT